MTDTSNRPPHLPPAPKRKAPRKPIMPRWLFWGRAVLVVALWPVLFAIAAAAMIIERDISAPTWVVDRIEARAGDFLDGATLEFGAISMRIRRDLHPTVRLYDTRIVDAGGLTLTRVPVVEGLISPRGLALQRDVLLQEVRLSGAQINLRRSADGAVAFALSTSGDALGQAGSLTGLFEEFDKIFERPALEALELVRADGLVVNYDDARAGRAWTVDGGQAVLDLRDRQTALRGSFSLLSGRAGVTQVSLSYVSPRGSPEAEIALNLTDAFAGDLATQSPALSWLRDVDAPISAALRTDIEADGGLGTLNAALDIGQGVLQPNPATAPVAFDAARAYFTFDPVRDRLSFSDLSIQSAWGNLRAEGDAYLREFSGGLPRALLAQLRFSDVSLNPPGFFEDAPSVASASAALRFRFDPFRVELGQGVVIDGETRMLAKGEAAATPEGWLITLDTTADSLTPDRLLDFWPLGVKPGTRNWISNNLTGGALTDLTMGLRITPGAPRQLAFGFGFDGSTIRFMRDMPPIEDGVGWAGIEKDQFTVSLSEGTVRPPEGGPLSLAGSHLTAVDLRLKPSPAVLDLTAEGTVTATLSLLNQPPFRFLDRAGLPVTLADGRARTQGRILWPLMPRPPGDAVVVAMTSELERVRTDRLIPGKTLIAPALDVAVDRQGLQIAGPVRVGAVNATGQWEQRFGDPSRPGSQVSAEITLSQAFLDEFGIALPRGTVGGQTTATLDIVLRPGQSPAYRLTSDLVGLSVGLPAVGWSKGRNTPGNLRVEGRLGAVPTVDVLEIGGGGLQARGTVRLTANGGLAEAAFTQVRVGDWLNAPITLRGQGRGAPPAVEIGGGFLDLRRARFGAGQGDSGPVSIRLDRLQVTEGIALTAFRGDFRSNQGFRGDFTAQLNGRAALQGTVAPRDGRSAVRLRSEDAGAVLRATGLLDSAIGGVIDLTLLPAGGEGTFDGVIDVRDIRLRDAPTMAALLDAISVVGLLQQLDGNGLSFTEVDARFRLTPDVLAVTEASAVGPGLGISLDGTYTLASKRIDMQGVVSPFYLVNSIGSFLTRRGEGLIGFNFNVRGTSAAPEVSVNPLSALTPGMFREIFRRPPPEIGQ